jgi:hypothetical protein
MQEHPMSDAKRDNSEFQRRAAASQTAVRRARASVTPLEFFELTPTWGSARAEGRDPYNAVGNRAASAMGKR